VEGNRFVNKGCWDSIHVVEVVQTAANKASYKLTTTVMLSMSVAKEEVGNTNMSGSLTRQVSLSLSISNEYNTPSHPCFHRARIHALSISMKILT
jgi:hypothetical protein